VKANNVKLRGALKNSSLCKRIIAPVGQMGDVIGEHIPPPYRVTNTEDYKIKIVNSPACPSANHKSVPCYLLTQKDSGSIAEKDCPVNKSKKTQKPIKAEQICSGRDNNPTNAEVHAFPILNDKGNVTEVIGTALARIDAEQQIESLARFPAENPSPVFRIAKDKIVLYANQAGQELLKQYNCGLGAQAPEDWEKCISTSLVSNTTQTCDLKCQQRVFSFTTTAVTESGYINMYALDVTEQRNAEQKILKLNEELEQRVAERTSKLTKTNKQLLWEIVRRKRLEREILDISEREQKRIGQELHDSVGQQFTGIAFMAKVLQQKLEKKSIPEATEAGQIVKLVNEATEQARGLAKGLFPVDLTGGTLTAALQELAESIHRLFGVECRFESKNQLKISSSTMAVQLYRIAQEAVANAIKHGRANNICIGLENGRAESVLSIESDGLDFPNKLPEKGLGLHIMNHRADIIGASLQVGKADHGGTIVKCIFPNKSGRIDTGKKP